LSVVYAVASSYFLSTAVAPTVIYTLSLHDALPISRWSGVIVESRVDKLLQRHGLGLEALDGKPGELEARLVREALRAPLASRPTDRKSTRLNSSHQIISYAVFCLKKNKQKNNQHDN